MKKDEEVKNVEDEAEDSSDIKLADSDKTEI